MPLYRLTAPHWLKLAGYAAPVYCPLGSTVEYDGTPSTAMVPLDEDAVAVIAKLESNESTAAVRRRRRVR
jgi:hypothetical protein